MEGEDQGDLLGISWLSNTKSVGVDNGIGRDEGMRILRVPVAEQELLRLQETGMATGFDLCGRPVQFIYLRIVWRKSCVGVNEVV